MDEERKTARGESDAAERIDGVAASSCGERKTAGELAGSGEASGAARPSTARSASPLPSPSPTPTFSGTNRPARRARRLRWQAGVPASMTALALFSFTLLVGGVAGYVSTIPGLLYEPPVPSLVPLGLAFASTDDAAKLSVVSSDGPSRNVGPVDQQEVAEQNAVSAALGLGAFGGVLGAGSLAAGLPFGAVDASFTKAVGGFEDPFVQRRFECGIEFRQLRFVRVGVGRGRGWRREFWRDWRRFNGGRLLFRRLCVRRVVGNAFALGSF